MSARSAVSKISDPKRLAATLARIRSGKRVVFTNGCFDLLHPGHVSTLERARALGDLLIVALNADASVSRLKGPTRPINRLDDRLTVMAALECVDYVSWFEEDTPLELILQLKPDVIAKGGDWAESQIVGAAEAKAWGGSVQSLPFIDGKSTTRIVDKMKG